MYRLFESCMTKPFSMVLEGVVDLEVTETEFIDLCCSIGDSMDFGICYPKTITEIRQFHTRYAIGYKNRFSFHVIFPNNKGTKNANKKFIEDKMAYLLERLLEDYLPVGLQDKFDYSGKMTYAVIKVPI